MYVTHSLGFLQAPDSEEGKEKIALGSERTHAC
jgi:hypothetical protein